MRQKADELVYGDLLNVFRVRPVGKSIEDIMKEAAELDIVLNKLLTLFISFVLAALGGDYSGFLRVESPLLTTKFKNQNWISEYSRFKPIEETDSSNYWSVDYDFAKGGTIRIVVTRDPNIYSIRSGDGKPEGTYLAESMFQADAQNLVVADPRLSKVTREDFVKCKKALYELTGREILFTTDEFAFRYIPDNQKRDSLTDEWIILRNAIIGKLYSKKPWLVASAKQGLVSQIYERLGKGDRFQSDRDYEHAIGEAGMACESLLNLIYLGVKGEEPTDLTFAPLLDETRQWIAESLGEDVVLDLEFGKDWRNSVNHPRRTKPTETDCIKVVRRSKLVCDLYCLVAGLA